MKRHYQTLAAGFLVGVLLLPAAFFSMYLVERDHTMIYHEVTLPSGKVVQTTAFHLAWGTEHGERFKNQDSFVLEYVSLAHSTDPQVKDQEAQEVFELIRPVAEQWGFDKASISVFPSLERKGPYEILAFARSPGGKWSFTRSSAKVFADD